ncbi:hypothetical protein PC121_g18961 [Phytophthora cactorum]|nr:hypothetical protein PC120_g18840 [Phytophthora cactorum]KAG3049349.1 hypothetical protein PC121_g18961 [Phytophthora cactorum]KAG4055684.1 hypothetical protein PC123_g9239 [Phytophthora cactorum]
MEAIRVTYRTALDSELRTFMTTQLIKYLLFIRGQIPCLYDELLQFVDNYELQQQKPVGGGRRRRLSMSGGIKKAIKCVEAAELLFRVQLDAIFSLRVKRVVLVFGVSLISPREAVVVDFDETETKTEDAGSASSNIDSPQTDQEDMSLEDSQTSTPPSPPMTREKQMRLCAQKLMRAVFTHAVEQFSSALSATKLHVAVLAERQSTRIPGFVPKQQFKLRLPKDKRGARAHYIVICDGADSIPQLQQHDVQHSASEQVSNGSSNNIENGSTVAGTLQSSTTALVSDPGLMWYVLEKPIPGFSEVINTLDGQ